MSAIVISNDTPANMLRYLARSIHRVTGGMPIALKSRNKPGVLIDHDGSVDTGYESEALDCVFADSDVRRVRVETGKYTGMPMMISPIEDTDGHIVAAIGVIDAMGSLSLQEFAVISERIKSQVINGL